MTYSLLKPSTPTGRWSGIGPYYAMFPRDFALNVIEKYSEVGHSVLDPFAGRGTSIYAAAMLNRQGYGIEISPVGWIYGKAKLNPANKKNLLKRNQEIGELSHDQIEPEIEELSEFFSYCYSDKVLRYLVAARKHLRWKTNSTDTTLMALILVNLHGRREASLSNQMRQSKAMHPDYSIRWWRDRNMTPPDIDPVSFMIDRIEWRYAKDIKIFKESKMILGDSTSKLKNLVKEVKSNKQKPFNLLFTSPPYYKITNYHYDQWIRLWMLGNACRPTWTGERCKGKFESKSDYETLLYEIFSECLKVMSEKAIVYVRTDARKFTLEITQSVLSNVFMDKKIQLIPRPCLKETQTSLYGDKSSKPGDFDIILTP
jgi:DNA modification methylase